MKLSVLATNALKLIKSHSPEIFTVLAVGGVVTTAYLAAKAGHEASKVLEEEEVNPDRKERIKEQIKQTWPLYVPAAISGTLTVGCIVGSAKTSSRRTAAAVTAYSLTERAFSEYREKVVEQIGKNKEQAVRDEIAQDKINKNPPKSNEVVIVGKGHILCCELYTNRYFRSDMESLRRAQNDINAKILQELYVTLDEFYYLIGLSNTSNSDIMGWDSNKMLELQFSTALSGDGEPCLTFEYNYTKPLK